MPLFEPTIIYCDASVRNNRCGIGICRLENGAPKEVIAKRILKTDSLRAEAQAVLTALALAKNQGRKRVRIYTDAQALVSIAQRNRPRSKFARWFLKQLKRFRKTMHLRLVYIKGHAGHIWNELCDKLAKNARWTIQDIPLLLSRWITWLGHIPITRQ